MTIIDIILLVVIGAGAVIGFIKGFIKQLASILGLIDVYKRQPMDRANSSLISNYWLSSMQKDSKKPVLLTLRFYKRVEIASYSVS